MGTNAEEVAREETIERAFGVKRINLIDDYDLISKPALIWQCWPADEFSLDVLSDGVLNAMRGGGGPTASEYWWGGFRMQWQPTLVFDGIASTKDHGNTGWVTELHTDGCLSACVWTFPELNLDSGTSTLGVADFYANAFHDFAFLGRKIYEATGYEKKLYLTATMHHANQLVLLGNHNRVLAPAPKRKTLRWPIACTNVSELAADGADMAERFMRIYGRKLSTA
jgi:hypothetical protein